MRLIDADELIKDKVSNAYISIFEVQNAPTVEAEPIRHGKWKKVSDKAPKYCCTECNHLYNNKEYKRCPNCGAKMDKKEQWK